MSPIPTPAPAEQAAKVELLLELFQRAGDVNMSEAVLRESLAAILGSVVAPAEPVGVLCVSHYLGDPGMENIEYQPMKDLPPGQHYLYAAPVLLVAEQPNSEPNSFHLTASVPSETVQTALPAYSIYHIDDCMYVAALSEADARAYVKRECGDDCGESVEAGGYAGMLVETADVDEGEKPTGSSKQPAARVVQRHLATGGALPWIVAFDAGL